MTDPDGEKVIQWARNMPLQNLIDKVCETGAKITKEQLERIQQYVIGDHGRPADEVTKYTEPIHFFAYLMEKKFISFTNLAFFQAIFRRIGRQDLCDIVLEFAREHSNDPLYLEVHNTDQGGNTQFNVHVRDTLRERREVEILVRSLANCLDVPPEYIRVVGTEATNSFKLTLFIPAQYKGSLLDMNKLIGLIKYNIDEVEVDGKTIKLSLEEEK
ncbi:uncharacterized protein [Haliotis cracherodii]|uniref:uncharacterized protein n=1 Tax=Haliotis cracherodii TaxID=6455 RepID=UPI0039EB455C